MYFDLTVAFEYSAAVLCHQRQQSILLCPSLVLASPTRLIPPLLSGNLMPAGEFTFRSLLCVHLVCTLHLCLSSVGQIKTFFVEVVSADRKGGVGSALPDNVLQCIAGVG